MAVGDKSLYRELPGVGAVLERADVAALLGRYSHERVRAEVRAVLGAMRAALAAGALDGPGLATGVGEIGVRVERGLAARLRPRLRRVVNATGVILQTNQGRAPLSEAAIAHVAEVARGYCNLEFDLETGERGRRDGLVEGLILAVLGLGKDGRGQTILASPGLASGRVEERAPGVVAAPMNGEPGVVAEWGAAVVNNCAAATFLGLNTLAEGGEVLVSRGELVEIGGGFRIPEILRKSGAVLREVGTTNKTRVGDYAAAVGPGTRLILRVHRSNFEIRGFTEQPSLKELVALGQRVGVPVFADEGTGCLVDLAEVGLAGESSWAASVRSGADLVAASGDKLLGGPQCGLMVGRWEVIERVRANPLFRALRVDKLTYAALEATLLAYLAGDEGALPVVSMLRMPAEVVRGRCERWAAALRGEGVSAEVVEVRSVVGGGTTPGASVASFAVALRCDRVSEGALAARLRRLEPAVVGRVSEGRVLLDLRTVPEGEDAEVLGVLRAAFGDVRKGCEEA